ncbi:MAG TPA: TadE family protein [Bacillales bacterium]|nr:TadE family protein [Bacillales bacterium]
MIRNERGQSLVEMALILPLLLLLFSGIFDMGRVLFTYLNLQSVAQDTVRMAGLGEGDDRIVSFAREDVELSDPSSLNVAISPSEADRESGDYVTVTLRYPFHLITPFISAIIPSPLVISVDSTIRVE